MKTILLSIILLVLFNPFSQAEPMEKTGKNDPLRIYWLEAADTEPGKIGITTLPGRKDGKHSRSLRDDIETLKHHRVTHVVTLVPGEDLKAYGVPGLPGTMEKAGLKTYHLGIQDYKVCSTAQMKQLLQWLQEKKSQGKSVVIHCVGGLGRSGLVAAAYLVAEKNMTAARAIAEIRRIRSPQAVETEIQEKFLAEFEKAAK